MYMNIHCTQNAGAITYMASDLKQFNNQIEHNIFYLLWTIIVCL